MAVNELWSMHEAAILLDGLLRYRANRMTRKEAIALVSHQLRIMALNRGQAIDDTYRNENGITFQMSSMESAWAGHTLMKPATQLFREMVRIYQNDRGRYQKTLEEARTLIRSREKANEEAFRKWLSSKVRLLQFSEFYEALSEIDKKAKECKLVDSSLYEGLDKVTIEKLVKRLRDDPRLRFEKRQLNIVSTALGYLMQYVNGVPAGAIRPAATDSVKKDADSKGVIEKAQAKVYYDDVQTKKAVARPSIPKTLSVNFDNISIKDTAVPCSLTYFGDVKEETNWEDTYIDACKLLSEDYPYDFCRLKNKGINGNDKLWLVDIYSIYKIKTPKAVGDDYYVETNCSVTDMLRNLKWLLDECRIDHENLEITYTESSNSIDQNGAENEPTKPTVLPVADKGITTVPQKEGFVNAYPKVAQEKGMDIIAELKARNIEFIDKREKGGCLWIIGGKELKDFVTYCSQNGVSFTYCRVGSNSSGFRSSWYTKTKTSGAVDLQDTKNATDLTVAKSQTEEQQRGVKIALNDSPSFTAAAPLNDILSKYFPKGYRLGSSIDFKRFGKYYKDDTGKDLNWTQQQFEMRMHKLGIVYKDKVFAPQAMLSTEKKKKILSYIDDSFAKGNTAIYYDALFQKFNVELLGEVIYDAEMLRAYLEHYLKNRYHIGAKFIAKNASAVPDPVAEVRRCLKNHGTTMSVNALCNRLSHLSPKNIKLILDFNGEFICNIKGSKSEYFHADCLDLSKAELDSIADIIDQAIKEHHFISGNELYDALNSKYPHFFEKNADISMLGWRNALKYKLEDRFSFKGNIISKANTQLTMSDVFAEYGKKRSHFSFDELKQYAESLQTVIYFDQLYENTLRISQKEFVQKSDVHFPVTDIDAVLERYCSGRYIPLAAIKSFAGFPDAAYPWNKFLLEQYVAFFSAKFRLVHYTFNEKVAVGAIVRKDSSIDTFDALVTDVLAHGPVPLEKDKALDHLVEEGYLARRSYSKIDELLIEARALRNKTMAINNKKGN